MWTSDIGRAHRVAHAIDTGLCWINSQNVRDLRTPFGGVKQSGVGREGGDYAFEFYCELETVHVALRDHPIPRLGLPAMTPSKQERTYAILRSRILDGTYGPGQRLVIDALARDLDVSPMPVREAIRRLEAEGWLTYQRHQGAQVAPLDEAGWMEALTTLAVLEGYATALERAAPDRRRHRAARARSTQACARRSRRSTSWPSPSATSRSTAR